ncbi:DNA cytosine methyltransferase, partial [Pirellulales bacterium]|nr:DNA cytosine methyltransferase [Pirellulales bacterium]
RWQLLYANDLDAKKKQMYEGHFGPSARYHLGDVWNTDDVIAGIEERPFLATASFPCTDMSLAGKRRGFTGVESSALFGFLRAVDQLGEARPPLLLLENVTGFLNSKGGLDFAAAVRRLAELGYWLDAVQIDARWFVPQSRPRLFLIGYHESIVDEAPVIRRDEADWFNDPWRRAIAKTDQLRPKRLLAAIDELADAAGWATVEAQNPPQAAYDLSDLLDFDDSQPWWDENQLTRHVAMLTDRHSQKIDAIRSQSETTLAMTAYRRMRAGKQRLEVRFDGIAGCLRTPRGGSAKQIVVVVDRGELRMRWMTPREYARLQGADDYVLPENTIQGLFGFGDAVCVPAIRWIDANFLTPVYDAAAARSREADARSVLSH